MDSYLLETYNPLPIAFERGEGAYLYDSDNNAYLDALGGIAVCALGHNHPCITHAIQSQAEKLLHTSNLYHIPHAESLAAKLCQLSQMKQAFFANSGAEVNEAALKLARLYAHQKGIDNPHIIVMEKSFHGRTLAMISASGSRKIQAGYEPLVQGFIRVPYNDAPAIEHILQSRQDIAAVMVEPIQGEGGILVPDSGYLAKIRVLCDKYDCLMIVDEVQTGMGRTGKFLAYQHDNILPDIVTLAKALGNGIPIGACLAGDKVLNLFKPGKHGSTFGGNPFATFVALQVLNTLEQDNLIERVKTLSQIILHTLQAELKDNPHVKAVRGKGLMIGIELDKPCREILNIGLKQGLLFNTTAENVIRLSPPYILSDEQAQQIADKIIICIDEFYQNQ